MRDTTGRFEHNFIMAGHPVSCAAGCAVLDELVRMDAPGYVQQNEQRFFEALAPLSEVPIVGDIRGRGFLAGVELVANLDTKAPFPKSERAAERVARIAFDEGVVVYPCAGGADGAGDHLLLMPPLVTPPEILDEIGVRLHRAVSRYATEVI
jgi:adenosylmethionine-8-amino-7-oxononanoate aminotransferase